ncbi:hypothetical protein COCNU_13G008080 [Cocos nucifera]|uniref:Uncharacterized protein n=1 Tax=Cocos nucifera TaxID=13894 RepID=A0A8K0IU55_COCNU|nr:hypothetical protein COCNU_13G008080 [Cocos nucifera]
MDVAYVEAGLVVEATTEMVTVVSLVCAIMEMVKNLFEGTIKTMGVAELPSLIRAVEVIDRGPTLSREQTCFGWGRCSTSDGGSLEIPRLKELLSEQTLFNVGLSQVSSKGKDLSPPKVLGLEDSLKEKSRYDRWQIYLCLAIGRALENEEAKGSGLLIQRSTEENAQLLRINKALEAEVEELKA